MLDATKYVSGGFALAAFIAIPFVIFLRMRIRERERLIRSLSGDDRAKLIEDALESFRLNLGGLTAEQRFDVAMRCIQSREHFFSLAITTLATLGTVGAAVAGYFQVADYGSHVEGRPPKIEGIGFLPADAKSEEGGYALYTYVLFVKGPDPDKRNTAIIDAFLARLSDAERLEKVGFKREEMNLVKMLVTTNPPADPTGDWVASHYDYARASYWLNMLSAVITNNNRGPYIISLTNQMTSIEQGPSQKVYPVLVQDFSRVLPTVAQLWVDTYLKAARTGRKDLSIGTFNDIRTTVAAISLDVPDVTTTFGTFLSLFKGKEEGASKGSGGEEKPKKE